MLPLDLDAPQLGEHVWHAFTDDQGVAAVSLEHRDRIEGLVKRHLGLLDWSRGRFLEVGAYRHYTGHLLAFTQGTQSVVTDIAAASLRDGKAQAEANGVPGKAAMVVADFHDFPFSESYFDVVFVMSSVHHTRSPERVLREMMRVLKPGGILILENEPCARACCFHAFVSNREDSFTPYEESLHKNGLLPTISSPFWGARAEQLFGMVENDRIPLSLYMDVLGEQGGVLERRLAKNALVGDFERELLNLPRSRSLPARVRSLLRSAVDRATVGFGQEEQLLGYRLPTECEIHELGARVTRLLERRPRFGDTKEWRAEMFGTALTMVMRKRAGTNETANTLFRRDMATESDGLVREQADTVAGRLSNQLLPDLHACQDAASMDRWFPQAEWEWVNEEHGSSSMVNRSSRSRVLLGPQSSRTLLLIRYYAVVANRLPYKVRVWGSGRLLDDQTIAIEESRLVRAWVPPGCSEIVVETCGLDEAPTAIPCQVRIGVFQLFDVG